MKALGATLIFALSLVGPLDDAEAGGRRGGHWSRGGRGHHHGHRPPDHHHHRGFGHRGFVHRPFFPAFVSPSVIVSAPVVVAPSPVYAPAQIYSTGPAWTPPPAYAAPPAPPPPVPRVVEYPGGRYELRGDGVTSPYVWVWIPDPPAAPPAPAPPAAPPAGAPEPSLSPRSGGPRSTAYRWTDDAGVTTWTDSLEKVPARFRAQAARSAVSR